MGVIYGKSVKISGLRKRSYKHSETAVLKIKDELQNVRCVDISGTPS